MGGALCVASTAEITKEDLGSGAQVGQSTTKALTFVDDIAGMNTSTSDTYKSHREIVWFSLKKRLSLNGPKCLLMCINKKIRDVAPRLAIDDELLNEAEKADYLGDTFNRLGNNWDLIEKRVKKGQGCIVVSMSLCSEITLGVYAIQTLLLLYKSVFIAVVVYNAQAWSNVNDKQLTALRTIQLKFIKRIFFVPSSTSNTLSYLETGTLPIDNVIHIKQLVFLHHILTLPIDDPVQINYHEQSKFLYEPNWVNEVCDIRKKYMIDENEEEISNMSKNQWKQLVKRRVTSHTLDELNLQLKQIKHTENLAPYDELAPQPYMSGLVPVYARIMFQIRTHIIDLKSVRKFKYDDTVCRLCGDDNETVHHVVNQCKMVARTFEVNLMSCDISVMEETAKRCKEFLNMVDESSRLSKLNNDSIHK